MRLDQKFKKLLSEINENLYVFVTKTTTDIINESITQLKQEILKLKERVDILEANTVHNDLDICGLKINESVNKDIAQNKPQPTLNNEAPNSALRHVRNDLSIPIETRDINFVYSSKKINAKDQVNQILLRFHHQQ